MLRRMRRNKTSSKSRQAGLTAWARQVRKVVNWAAAGIALIYVFLHIGGMFYGPVLKALDAGQVWKVLIAVYYLCWIKGLNHDIDLQELVYSTGPEGNKLRLPEFAVIALIVLVAVGLIWSIRDERYFAAFLTIFFALNVISWRFLLRRIRPIVANSVDAYHEEEDWFAKERLAAFSSYIAGEWQWQRFLAMGAVLVVLIMVTFVVSLRGFISHSLVALDGELPDTAQTSALLAPALFLLFTVVEESWIWIRRLRTDLTLSITSDLEEKYKIEPKASRALR